MTAEIEAEELTTDPQIKGSNPTAAQHQEDVL